MPAIGSVTSSNYSPGITWPKATNAATPDQAAKPNQAAIDAARQALAVANSAVDTDKRNHSPSCVACDQKLVDKAQQQLAAAKAQTSPGSVLDVSL